MSQVKSAMLTSGEQDAAVERAQMRENLRQCSIIQRTLNQVLRVAMRDLSLQEMFDQTIDHLTSVSWLELDRKGALFLVETGPDRLVMQAHRGLPAPAVEACAQVPFDQCICGQAAASGKAGLAKPTDENQECGCNGERPCCHYVVPMLSGGALLGIVKLYTRRQHQYDARDEQFLQSVADILGTAIKRNRAEEMQAKLLMELENANRSLWNFLHRVSHDVKRPLLLLKTLANYLVNDYGDEMDENGRMWLSQLQGRLSGMNSLIDDLLRNSRLACSREELAQVDLNELVQELITMLAPPQNPTIQVQDRLPVVECEWTRIAEALHNLLSNAINHVDESAGQIEVTCEESKQWWKLGISDNGPRMEQAHLERVFALSSDLPLQDSAKRTSIGLLVAKGIIESYGGRVWVDSQTTKGNRLFFTLPRQQVEVNRANAEANTAR